MEAAFSCRCISCECQRCIIAVYLCVYTGLEERIVDVEQELDIERRELEKWQKYRVCEKYNPIASTQNVLSKLTHRTV